MRIQISLASMLAFSAALGGCKGGGSSLGTLSPTTTGSASVTSSTSAPSSSALASVTPSVTPSASPVIGSHGWVWRGADPGFTNSFYSGPIGIDAGSGICRFIYDRPNERTTIECFDKGAPKRRWGRDEGGGFVDDAALIADEQNLYVARFSDISSGCEVTAYRLAGGDQIWRAHLVGLGPIAHSEYLNKVEMGFGAAGKIHVFGWESAGRYIEEIDAANGRTLATRRLDGPGAPLDVPPPPTVELGEPPHPGEAEKAVFFFGTKRPDMSVAKDSTAKLADGGHCTYSFSDKDQVALSCFDAKSKRTWGFDLAQQFVAAGEIASFDKLVIVSSYCAISSGAVVTAYDSSTGRPVWQTSLFAIGPIDHSKYSNVVDMRITNRKVVISGWESSGKYVEVLDPSTGRDMGNRNRF